MKTSIRFFSVVVAAAISLSAGAQQPRTTGAGSSAVAGGTAITVNSDGSRVPQPAPDGSQQIVTEGGVITTNPDGTRTVTTASGTHIRTLPAPSQPDMTGVSGASNPATTDANSVESASGSSTDASVNGGAAIDTANGNGVPAGEAGAAGQAGQISPDASTVSDDAGSTTGGAAIDSATGNGAPNGTASGVNGTTTISPDPTGGNTGSQPSSGINNGSSSSLGGSGSSSSSGASATGSSSGASGDDSPTGGR